MRNLLLAIILIGGGSASASAQTTSVPARALSPPPIIDCSMGPYIVFFDWDRIAVSGAAAVILDNAISSWRDCMMGYATFVVGGYADRSGAALYNHLLSRRRARSVARYLRAHGVPADAVDVRAHGENDFLVSTRDGVPEHQNRRVEIQFGARPGNVSGPIERFQDRARPSRP